MTVDELAELLMETGRKHHAAFAVSDGADPEWAKWYAGYLQAQLWDRLGSLPSQSELIYTLVAADKAHANAAPDEPWPSFYAARLLEQFGD